MARFTGVALLRPGRRQTVQGYTQVVDEEVTSADRLGWHVRPRTTSKKADELMGESYAHLFKQM